MTMARHVVTAARRVRTLTLVIVFVLLVAVLALDAFAARYGQPLPGSPLRSATIDAGQRPDPGTAP